MIIFINGSINSGKSTVSKLLAKELPNIALMEVDVLRAMIDWMSIDQAVPINLENAVSLIKNFTARGFNVVVTYPLSQDNFEYISDQFVDTGVETLAFTLAPKLEVILKNRGSRELNDWERKRILHHYDIGIQNPLFGEIIDNSNQTPIETVNYILDKIKAI